MYGKGNAAPAQPKKDLNYPQETFKRATEENKQESTVDIDLLDQSTKIVMTSKSKIKEDFLELDAEDRHGDLLSMGGLSIQENPKRNVKSVPETNFDSLFNLDATPAKFIDSSAKSDPFNKSAKPAESIKTSFNLFDNTSKNSDLDLFEHEPQLSNDLFTVSKKSEASLLDFGALNSNPNINPIQNPLDDLFTQNPRTNQPDLLGDFAKPNIDIFSTPKTSAKNTGDNWMNFNVETQSKKQEKTAFDDLFA